MLVGLVVAGGDVVPQVRKDICPSDASLSGAGECGTGDSVVFPVSSSLRFDSEGIEETGVNRGPLSLSSWVGDCVSDGAIAPSCVSVTGVGGEDVGAPEGGPGGICDEMGLLRLWSFLT